MRPSRLAVARQTRQTRVTQPLATGSAPAGTTIGIERVICINYLPAAGANPWQMKPSIAF
jgi:hypothetical protein